MRPGTGGIVLAAAAAALAVASAGMLLGVEPFASWYYLFAWYPTIAAADAWAHRRDPSRHRLLLAQPGALASLLAWSAVFWFSFELWNLRLENWYYVGAARLRPVRWAGAVAAFATVLPGLFAVAGLLATWGIGEGVRLPAIRMTRGRLRALTVLGAVAAALVLGWPGRFYPLVWGAVFFLLAPFNYRRGRGLLRDLEGGRWGPALRLLVAGAICGFLWELFNIRASAKWIYTVPGFEGTKLFEMPALGFLGFPPFALECWEMYLAVVHLGWARDWDPAGRDEGAPRERARPPSGRRWIALGVAQTSFAAVTLLLMDRQTFDANVPCARELPAVDAGLAARLDSLGVGDLGELAGLLEARPAARAASLGLTPAAAARLRDQVALALLRGIGSKHAAELVAAGVGDIDALARIDPAELEARLRAASPDRRPKPARLRVWMRAARSAVADRATSPPTPGSGPSGRP